jgi:Ca2+-transporting ATPase
MQFYLMSAEEALNEVKGSRGGLETSDASARLEQNGKNKLEEAKKDSLFKKFLAQISDPMIIMLLIAAGISVVTSLYENESFMDVFVILFVVIVNAVLGLVQENKAEASIEALKEMTAATSKVLRDGAISVVRSEDLVVGDVVLLEAGDSIPADGRIIESASLKIEEAALTGESVPVSKLIDILNLSQTQKDVPLGDRKNMAYMGSTVTYGRGKMLVTGTGMATEMGKIATALTNTVEGATPLQKKLTSLGKNLSIMVVGICIVVFAVTLMQAGSFTIDTILDTFMVAVALAVAAIPEGLPAVVTIVLSIGVTKMSKRNAVIRKLMAVETLGSTQIICSDKTGTLTQNKMTVVEHDAEDEELLAVSMSLCSDATIKDGVEVGDPTEVALVIYADKLNRPQAEITKVYPRIGEAPFDSNRKMMSTVHERADGTIVQYTKGAPDILLTRCSYYLKGGKVLPMTDAKLKEVIDSNKRFADKALRVLAGAYRDYDTPPESYEADDLEHDLVFIGLVGMIDPSRPEVKDAVKQCESAGIRPIMITGDHKDTAVAIALELGIIKDPSSAITGADLDEISDEQFKKDIEKYSVYARVQPEHKVRIVKAWQSHDLVTAMTGDGVNDAPSIKTADIGVGMGITGTDVTKNVADMVLADDNFATIVSAVEEGRKVYDNIRKVLLFLLSANLAEVISVFASSLIGFTIFAPTHLLWVNLITDAAPALALGMEEAENDIMKRAPRPSNEGIFEGFTVDIILHGIFITLIVMASYFIGHHMNTGNWVIENSLHGSTMAFLTLSFAEIFHSFNMRSQTKSLVSLRYQNKYLWGSAFLSLILTSVVIFIPQLATVFSFEVIDMREYAVAMLLAFSIIPLVEISKLFKKKK